MSRSPARTAARAALLAAGALALVELLGHAGYRALTGRYIWQPDEESDVFTVLPYLQLVDDERLVTNRPGAAYDNFRLPAPPRRGGFWSAHIDENGFRAGDGEYGRSRPNVVFLGDSVPFGLGVPDDQTEPSAFARLLASRGVRLGVINAGVPGYDLTQAAARYRAEVSGRYPVRAVVLQIYDPAVSFMLWGGRWGRTSSWYAEDAAALRAGRWCPPALWAYRYSFIVNALRRRDIRRGFLQSREEDQLARFDRVNEGVLEELRAAVARDGGTLYLLPVNPARPMSEALRRRESRDLARIVARLNASLRRFAATHEHVRYVDVADAFDRAGREGLFVDGCCHLSERGGALQARLVYDALSRDGALR